MSVNIEKWLAEFEKGAKVIIKVSANIIYAAAEEFLKIVKEKTPVGDPTLWKYPAPHGYVPGSLRAAWEMESSGSEASRTITIHNDLPYAQRVEYGWSTQAPNGMMRLTIKEFPEIIKRVTK